jgi:hypothetical protein
MPEIVKATVKNPGAFASGLKGSAHLSPGLAIAGLEERADTLAGVGLVVSTSTRTRLSGTPRGFSIFVM